MTTDVKTLAKRTMIDSELEMFETGLQEARDQNLIVCCHFSGLLEFSGVRTQMPLRESDDRLLRDLPYRLPIPASRFRAIHIKTRKVSSEPPK